MQQHEAVEAPEAVARDVPAPATYEAELYKGAYGLGIYFAAAQAGDGRPGSALVDEKVPFYRLPTGGLAPGEASGVIAPGDTLLSVNTRDVSGLLFPQVVEELRRVPQGPVTLFFQRHVADLETRELEPQKTETQELSEEEEENDEMLREEVKPYEPQREEDEARGKRWGVFQRLSAGAASVAAAVPVVSPSASSSPAVTEMTSTATTPILQELEDRVQELEAALAREQKCRFLAERKNVLYRNELLRVSQENATLRDQQARQKQKQQRGEAFVASALHLAI